MRSEIETSIQTIHAESLYYHIASKAIERAKIATTTVDVRENIAIAITFSALCLEAFINQQYYSCHQTKDIDPSQINLAAKWLILPTALGASETFKADAAPFQTFKELISIRSDRFVHFKPHKENIIKKQGVPANKPHKGEDFISLTLNIGKAEKFFNCIREMIVELNMLTNGRTELPFFLEGKNYISSEPFSISAGLLISVVPSETGD